VGSIQYYFETKEMLLEACLDGYHERLAALAADLTETLRSRDASAPLELIDRSTAALFAFARKERGLLRFRAASTFSRGELAPARQRDFIGGLSELAADALAPHVQVPRLDARLAVHAMSATIVRFALMNDAEVAWATGLEHEAAHAALAAYVPRAARRLLRLPEVDV
jgi:AcrR family transcriptional regulator